MDRNLFELRGFVLAPVLDFTIFTGASSFAGDEDIDDFILHDAKRHFDHKMAVTYSLTELDDPNPLAFATLQNDAINIGGSEYDGFPYKSFPAVKIGRLGVSMPYQGYGVGSFLLYMVGEFMCRANRTGCRFLTLDAYNTEKTIHFYKKNGFSMLKDYKEVHKHRTIPMYRDLM